MTSSIRESKSRPKGPAQGLPSAVDARMGLVTLGVLVTVGCQVAIPGKPGTKAEKARPGRSCRVVVERVTRVQATDVLAFPQHPVTTVMQS
jgi:hypothetical protein